MKNKIQILVLFFIWSLSVRLYGQCNSIVSFNIQSTTCVGVSTQFNAILPLGTDSIIVNWGDSTSDTIFNSTTGFKNFTSSGSFNLVVHLFEGGAVSCDSIVDTIQVIDFANADFTQNIDSVCDGGTVEFNATNLGCFELLSLLKRTFKFIEI